MRKVISLLLAVVLLVSLGITVQAEDASREYFFELSVDGSDLKKVQTGDIITVVFTLHRVDSEVTSQMYAMQNEIRYDGTFFRLVERVFPYELTLSGSLAEDASIVSAEYTTDSGEDSGDLATDRGTLILNPAPGRDREIYHITVMVKTGARTVLYRYKVTYQETLDVQLQFHWMEKGAVKRTKICIPEETATLRVKKNQLSANAIPYEMELTGNDGVNGSIQSVSYISDSGDSGNRESAGSLELSVAPGSSFNVYQITVVAMVNGQRIYFRLNIHLSLDVSRCKWNTASGKTESRCPGRSSARIPAPQPPKPSMLTSFPMVCCGIPWA